jgi:hypothetical protein
VSLQHFDSSLTYQTDTGAETYSHGTGEFCIITDGPIAEVYWNGQFAFSYYLPRTTEQTCSHTGAISDFSVSATPERKNYFISRNVTPQNEVYDLADFPYSYNLDFVAGGDDQLTLSVNDGYYLSKLSIENGKLYLWDGPDKMALSEKTFVEDVSEEAYYRLETSGGMSRLYKNGRWITTIRGEHALAPLIWQLILPKAVFLILLSTIAPMFISTRTVLMKPVRYLRWISGEPRTSVNLSRMVIWFLMHPERPMLWRNYMRSVAISTYPLKLMFLPSETGLPVDSGSF